MDSTTAVVESRHRLLLRSFQRRRSREAHLSSPLSAPFAMSHGEEEKKQIDARIGKELDELMKSFSDIVTDDDETIRDDDDVSIARSVQQKLRKEQRHSGGVKITAVASWSASTPVNTKQVKRDGVFDGIGSVGSLSTATTEALTASSCGSNHQASSPVMMPRRLNLGGAGGLDEDDDERERLSPRMRPPLVEVEDEDQDELNDVMGPMDCEVASERSGGGEAVELDGAVAPLSTPLVSLLDLSADTQTVGEDEEEEDYRNDEAELNEGIDRRNHHLELESVHDIEDSAEKQQEAGCKPFDATSNDIRHHVPAVRSEDTMDGIASLDLHNDRYEIPHERSEGDAVDEECIGPRERAMTASVAAVVAEEVQVLALESRTDHKDEEESEKENVCSPEASPPKRSRLVASQGKKEENAQTMKPTAELRPSRPTLPKSGSSLAMVSSTFTTPKLSTGWADSFMDKSTESIRNVTESIVESFCPAVGSVVEEETNQGKQSLLQKKRKKRVSSTSDIPLPSLKTSIMRGHPNRVESLDESSGTPRRDNLSWDLLSATGGASLPPITTPPWDEEPSNEEKLGTPNGTMENAKNYVAPAQPHTTDQSGEAPLAMEPTMLATPLNAPLITSLDDDDDDDDVCQPLAMVGFRCRTDPSYYLDYDVTGAAATCATQGPAKSWSNASADETTVAKEAGDRVRQEGKTLHASLKLRLLRRRVRNRAGESAKRREQRTRQLREIFLPPQPVAAAVAKAHGKWWRKFHPDSEDVCPSLEQDDQFGLPKHPTNAKDDDTDNNFLSDDDSPPDEIRLSKSVDYHLYDPSSSRLLPQSPARRSFRKQSRSFLGRWNGGTSHLLDDGDMFSGLFQCGTPQMTPTDPSLVGSIYYEDHCLDKMSFVDDDSSTCVPPTAHAPERRARAYPNESQTPGDSRAADAMHKDFCYDSDPGDAVFRRADLLLNSLTNGKSGRRTPMGAEDGVDAEDGANTSFGSHSSFVKLTLRELQKYDFADRNALAKRYVAETMNTTWVLTWHPTIDDMARQDLYRKGGMDDFLSPLGADGAETPPQPTSSAIHKLSVGSRHPTPIQIQLWLERGSRIRRQGAIEPKIMWREAAQTLLPTRRVLNETTVRPYRISLFSVRRVRAVRRILDRTRYPLAKKAACFIVETFDREQFVFEARNTTERDDLVRSWKVLIWRLAEHVNAGDDDGIAEDYFVPISFEPPDSTEERQFMSLDEMDELEDEVAIVRESM